MKPYNILLADDEEQMLNLVTSYLEKEGHRVVKALNGKEALVKMTQEIDLVVLDVMMPVLDGFSTCQEIRKHSNVPIIMLTAKGREMDKVQGLKIGADDYIVKPFSPKELVARIEALIRRSVGFKQEKLLQFNELVVDVEGHNVTVNQSEILLTRKEYLLLEFLLQSRGQVFSREQLLDHIWGYDSVGTIRTVDTHIKTLRLKLKEAGGYIKTVWGVGYKFDV
ncbi:response regulator transcription factor [Bacillus sp. AK128]